MKVTYRYESLNARNESEYDTFDIDFGEFAFMVETDRRERAERMRKPIEEIKPRHPQRILNDLWNAEERVAHEAKRGDRGPGKKKCVCSKGCAPRRGCRVPSNHPWSLEQLLEIDRAPGSPVASPEEELITAEQVRVRESDLETMREAIETLKENHRQIIDLMLTQELTQAEVSRHLGVTRGRVSQLFSEAKTLLREAVEKSRLNTSRVVGSGVKGMAVGANPTNAGR